MAGPEDEPFLSRWSRRKEEARQGAEPLELAPAQGADIPSESDADEQSPDEDHIDPATLPDVESLTAESDFSVFMQKGVPEEIRQVALRRLWRLDPVLANVDGLVDYGEDFTDKALVIKGLKTVYRVGKGMLTDKELGIETDEDETEVAAADEAPDGDADLLGDDTELAQSAIQPDHQKDHLQDAEKVAQSSDDAV